MVKGVRPSNVSKQVNQRIYIVKIPLVSKLFLSFPCSVTPPSSLSPYTQGKPTILNKYLVQRTLFPKQLGTLKHSLKGKMYIDVKSFILLVDKIYEVEDINDQIKKNNTLQMWQHKLSKDKNHGKQHEWAFSRECLKISTCQKDYHLLHEPLHNIVVTNQLPRLEQKLLRQMTNEL